MNRKLLFLIIASLFVCNACKRETKDEKFQRDFEQFTQKECPKFIDPCTRLDSACYDSESRTLNYYYSVQDLLDDEELYTEDLIESFHDNMLKELKGSIPLKGYKDEGITFCYIYRSMTTGKQLLELSFTKEDYGNR